MFWYVKYISSPCCLVCSLLLKQVGNKGKLLVKTFSFFLNSFRLCQQVSKLFLKLSLRTLFTRKTCYEAKHTLQKPAAAVDFFQYFIRHKLQQEKTESWKNTCKTPCMQCYCAQSKLLQCLSLRTRENIYMHSLQTERKPFSLQTCYGREQWEHISPDIKLYGLQSSAVISTLQWPYYVLFNKIVSILNIFSIFLDSCNTKHNHLPPS